MTEEDVRKIVRETVHEVLLAFGVNIEHPTDMQRDFQYLRSWREAVQTVKRQGAITSVVVIVTGLLGWIYAKATGHL